MTQANQEDGNVFQLLRYKRPMTNPVLVELLEYWERLRGDRAAPMRSEIDPRQIENALEHAFILERSQDGEVRFRIAGMRLADLMGMEIRGMPASSVIAPASRAAFGETLKQVFDGPEIAELQLEADRTGVAALSGQMLLLPMKNDRGDMSRILGCLVTTGLASSPPHRFTLAGKKVTRIIANGFAPMLEPARGFAEGPTPFTPSPVRILNRDPQRPKPGHLRLVKTDE